MTTLDGSFERPRKRVKSKEFNPIEYLESSLDKIEGTSISAKKITGGKVDGFFRVNWYSPTDYKVIKSQFVKLELINGSPVVTIMEKQ